MTPKYSLRKGTKILNRYEILRYISSGGFGITYEAFDLLSKRRIAIKELYITEICNRESDAITVTINDTNKPTFFAHRRKFLDEAKRLMELSHPNIIKVSDVFEANGTAYFAMDYIEGKPLSKEVVPMSENIAISIINPILDALEYIHNKGVLHLDIKPSNIMIDKHGKVILIDFGTSKVYGDADGKSLSLSTTLPSLRDMLLLSKCRSVQSKILAPIATSMLLVPLYIIYFRAASHYFRGRFLKTTKNCLALRISLPKRKMPFGKRLKWCAPHV